MQERWRHSTSPWLFGCAPLAGPSGLTSETSKLSGRTQKTRHQPRTVGHQHWLRSDHSLSSYRFTCLKASNWRVSAHVQSRHPCVDICRVSAGSVQETCQFSPYRWCRQGTNYNLPISELLLPSFAKTGIFELRSELRSRNGQKDRRSRCLGR